MLTIIGKTFLIKLFESLKISRQVFFFFLLLETEHVHIYLYSENIMVPFPFGLSLTKVFPSFQEVKGLQ